MSPETKNNPDQAPEPASPEELVEFKDLIHAKVAAAGKALKYKDTITEEDATAARWRVGDNLYVDVSIGTTHEPDYLEVLTHENLGLVHGIDTQIRKHYRYFPIAEISEYDEELAEYNSEGKRLIGEEIQRAMEQMPEVDEETLDEEKKLAIEHARDFSRRYKGSATPPIHKDNLDEIVAILAQCNPSNEDHPVTFA